MASRKEEYSADSFKKDISARNCRSKLLNSLELSSDENSSESDIELEFNNEDKTISLLYRKVVDDLMDLNKIRESDVNDAIHGMILDIAHGHKNDFRKFSGIRFSRPENCCGYLRRYAICYTGLVKKSMWNFFTDDRFSSKIATEEIVSKSHLRVVSLGGGPGNDLVGFCSALAEIPNSIQKLELIIIDINKGWKPIFPILLRKAKGTNFGSFSQCLEKKIITGFMEADLTTDEVYEDENLSSVLDQADVLLMVKLTSFLCSEEADKLLQAEAGTLVFPGVAYKKPSLLRRAVGCDPQEFQAFVSFTPIMASFKKDYSANFFKKEDSSKSKTVVTCREDQNHEANSKEETSNSDEASSKAETSSYDDSSSNETSGDESSSDETSSEDASSDEISSEDVFSSNDECSEDETLSDEEIVYFKGEDNLISILYRQVVDDIMDSKRLTESVVDTAIRDMKMKLHKTRKRGYRKFPLIDFNKPENCCAYLRRYAICYTGLVKRMMWNFFVNKNNTCEIAKNDIISNNYLKIVSLGGGPGNDSVGFCSALQEISNNVEQIKLTIVDNGTGWRHVFPKILQNAKDTNFGSFSECAQKNIVAQFIKADLTNDDVFRDENLSATLNEADLLFMVKFISYLADGVGPETLLHNVIDSMKPNAKFIFIDCPYDKEFFKGFESLYCIYRDSLRYEMCFKPRRYQSASIASTFAHVVVHEKKHFQSEDSSSSEDS